MQILEQLNVKTSCFPWAEAFPPYCQLEMGRPVAGALGLEMIAKHSEPRLLVMDHSHIPILEHWDYYVGR